MKNRYLGFILLSLFLLFGTQQVRAQCTGGTLAGTWVITTTFQTQAAAQAGTYYRFSATAGTSYTFTFCQGGGSATFDSQLTILDNTGAFAGGYNDDNCGLQSEVIWVAPSTGIFRCLINQFNCQATTATGTLAYRENPPLGPGANCVTPFVIPGLPFTQTGMSTCGYGDDFSSLDACGSFYMNGDDFVFTYASPGNEEITIDLTNTGTFVGVFVTDGCPNIATTNCIPASAGASCGGGTAPNESAAGNPTATFVLNTAGTYFITVSTFPAPQCTGFDINITTAPISGGGPGLGCYTVTTGAAYTPDSYTSGTLVTFPDDEHSPTVLPIGFTFCFMGTDYTQFVISSNSYITFNTACANQTSPWDTEPLPGAGASDPEVRNSIMFPWHDPDPGVAGEIRYRNYGTFPNRRLVVSFNDVAMFSAACNSLRYTGQVVLYETSNEIATFIQNKPVCASWNNGEAVHGLLDATGTVDVQVPGRNNTSWTAVNDAVRFTPTCAPCLIILQAEYAELYGNHVNGQNEIYWETTSEVSLANFELQRSADGLTFEPVGTVAAMGNQSQGAVYQLSDPSPHQVTYYRLREVNINGTATYSDVITVNSAAESFRLNGVHVDVNTDELRVNLDAYNVDRQVTIFITDAFGKRVYLEERTLSPGHHDLRFDVSALGAGYYMISIADGVRTRQVRKFMRF